MRELQDTTKQSDSEGLRSIIDVKVRDGRLPRARVPATFTGRPGDGSICGACDHIVTDRDLMMLVTGEKSPFSSRLEATPIPLHADCFELWNGAGCKYTPSS